MIKNTFIGLVCILAIAMMTKAQSSEKVHPLILVTVSDHSLVKSVDELNKIVGTIPNLRAITFNTDNIQQVGPKLGQLALEAKINKQKISSLQLSDAQVKEIQGVTFESVSTIEEIKSAFASSGGNLLLEIVWQRSQSRLLPEVHEESVPTVKSQETEQRSQLFANMEPATLTGLLVSLFLIIMLLIAVNCLYEIKTNDQFGRTNLWVGKES